MTEDLFFLIDKPVLLLCVLFVGGVIGIGIERLVEGQKRAARRAYWAGRNAAKRSRGGQNDYARTAKFLLAGKSNSKTSLDASDQLRIVMAASFKARALLNRPEANVFKTLDAAVIGRNPAWQVMAQVSLGEFLSSEDGEAYFAVNSKRVDFALMDERCRVRHAIEYQGTGHHLEGGAAAARDAVKKEALRKAGIGYHEVVAGHTTPAELKRLVERLVPPAVPPEPTTPTKAVPAPCGPVVQV
ncbi:DUF2726 domain-containing protein [Tsuneonella sp. YG55]|uniref:DUF2726 domain-containing protein n=1 Tax=Tsuneonella litorea TaxID=2976475 RepID=A0A9X3AAE9_9SPHN|nr:DUF2726 domain-containing protein [Tsuneonella litorea]MCT2559845.1 DUF2726 domain-containing protein [Tsuneonella litorea]